MNTKGNSLALRRLGARTATHLFLVVIALVMLMPFLWTLSTSLKSIEQVFEWPPSWLPRPVQIENYANALTRLPFGRYFLNTIFICFWTVVGSVFVSSSVAYGFARMKFPGRELLFTILMSTIMMPAPVTFIPLFVMYSNIGWINTYFPLIVPSFLGVGTTIYVFLMRQYFRTIPEAMSDAARMDGCSEFRLWWNIMLPLAKPALGVVALLSFQLAWNDFFQPLIYINRPELRTMALGLYSFKAMPGEITFYNQLMAVTMVMLLPMIVLFLIFQKHFLHGVVIGAIKG